jgi:hypothetical protein
VCGLLLTSQGHALNIVRVRLSLLPMHQSDRLPSSIADGLQQIEAAGGPRLRWQLVATAVTAVTAGTAVTCGPGLVALAM